MKPHTIESQKCRTEGFLSHDNKLQLIFSYLDFNIEFITIRFYLYSIYFETKLISSFITLRFLVKISIDNWSDTCTARTTESTHFPTLIHTYFTYRQFFFWLPFHILSIFLVQTQICKDTFLIVFWYLHFCFACL